MMDSSHNRASERLNLALEIHYRSAGAFLLSYSVNLSRGGLFVETATPLPTGTHIELKVHPPGEDPVFLTGEVAWVRASSTTPGEPPGMGISVHAPEDRFGTLVDRIAERFLGIRILLAVGPGQDRARSMMRRHLAAVVACDVIDLNDPNQDLLKENYDLAIVSVDWTFGGDVIRRLREADAHTPIIAIGRRLDARTRSKKLGANEVLENPPDFPELRTAVIHALSSPSAVEG